MPVITDTTALGVMVNCRVTDITVMLITSLLPSSLSDHAQSVKYSMSLANLHFIWKANILLRNLQQLIWVSDNKTSSLVRGQISSKYDPDWQSVTVKDFQKNVLSLVEASEGEWTEDKWLRDTGGLCHHVQTQQPHTSGLPPIAKQSTELQEACQARLPGPQRLALLF